MRRLAVLVPILAFALLAWAVLRLATETSDPGKMGGPATDQGEEVIAGAAELQGMPEHRRRSLSSRPRPPRRPEPLPTRVVEQAKAPHVLSGRVIDPKGLFLLHVFVWQVPKATMDAAKAASTTWNNTRARSRFHLGVWRDPDTWIGVRLPGRRTIFLDGATIRWEDEQEIVLPPAIELRVRVVNGKGEPLAGEVLRAEPAVRRGRPQPFAGPEAPMRTLIEQTNERGMATFALERDAPFDVSVADLRTDPPTLRLSGERPEGAFKEVEPARLELTVLDGDTGKHLEESIHLVFYDQHGAETDLAIGTDASPDVIEADLPLAPGRYLLEITARYRGAVLLTDLEVGTGGTVLRREVRMKPLEAYATLRIEGAPPAPAQRLQRPSLLIRRLDGGWDALGWTPWPGREHPDGALTLALLPGRYDVVMMLPASGTIAEYSDLRLEASKTTPVRFASRSGTLVELYALLPVDLDVRGIRVEIPGRGRFQLVGRAETTALACEEDTLRAIQGAGTRQRRDASKGPRLGPYPDGVVVVVTDDARREHRFPVR